MTTREFENEVTLHGKAVYSFLWKLCSNRDIADDLYQQTFLKAFEAREKIEKENNPKAFFISIAIGLWRNYYKKQARRNRIAPELDITEENQDMIAGYTDIEGEFLKKQKYIQIRQEIEKLKESFRIPILLYYGNEYSVEEIGKIMKLPPGTVKSRLSRARQIIKEKMEEAGYEN